ncbi:hypothetical protein P691DRAFT_768657 [Macrolepiota fuliginosa MF-IS2]|uniref:Uncharacterized protein n=1 Tax=Macrolepiota fuliginosa MF-IS2 TaxID=1400762 RepID=A0A9P6BVT8_9AGAR|nr:hypothetical protein P691DRAFT_768657 [Macrolepiota fuliginosa MF-IS2]
MPRKAKNKPATNAMPTYKPSAATEWFLAMMDQNHHIMSQFTTHEIMKIRGFDWIEIRNNLFKMNFTEVDASTQDNSAAIEVDNDNNALSYEELSPAEDLTNTIAAFGQWFKNNNITDNKCPSLIDNIRCLAMMFSLILAPHCCPTPPLCICPHQDNAPPCRCLHADDIPPPLPCAHPHHDNEDTPMEPSAPTHAFSKAASQTPAPSHEATMPSPHLAAAASIPKPRPSYTGAAAKNLNPAALLFVHGPPHIPVAPSAQASRVSLKPQSKRPFYVT